jgi:galactose-1-phosphate uridylyltransferase
MFNLHLHGRKKSFGAAEALRALENAPSQTTQQEIQKLLETVHEKDGLQAAMEGLYRWEIASGYISREKLEGNEHHLFFDARYEIEFHLQVNYGRSGYTPDGAADGHGHADSEVHSARPSFPGTPKCAICRENVGRPGKETLRIFEFSLEMTGRPFFLQLTPYPIFPYHFVVIAAEHVPMHLDRTSLEDMIAFGEAAPGYTVCSNSDVEWAGSSILEHHHLQVFKGLSLPAMRCRETKAFQHNGCTIAVLDYPLALVRVQARNRNRLLETADALLRTWKVRDPGRNTCNLIYTRERDGFSFYLFFRNPDFRTPKHLEKIKSEGIGIVEAAGVGILPVPSGPEEEEIWREIRKNGRQIMNDVLEGINPVPPELIPTIGGTT